jgi:hypothetical protein
MIGLQISCLSLGIKFTALCLFLLALNSRDVYAGPRQAAGCLKSLAGERPTRDVTAERPSVPLVTVSSWETLHSVLAGVLSKIGYEEPRFVLRSFHTDRLSQTLDSGTDRDDTSTIWNFGIDADSGERKNHGVTSERLIYAYLMNNSEFMESVPLDGEIEYGRMQSLQDIVRHNAKNDIYDHVVIYRASGLRRASSAEFWFNGNPRESILAVFKLASPEDMAKPLDDMAYREIQGKTGLGLKETSELLSFLLKSLPWARIDGFAITDPRTHKLWNSSEARIEIGLLPTSQNEQAIDLTGIENQLARFKMSFPKPLATLLDRNGLITEEANRKLKVIVHNHMFDVNYASQGLRPNADNPFLGLPVPLTSENQVVRSEYLSLFDRLNPGSVKEGVGFHTQDAVFVLKPTATSNRDAARLRSLGYRYIYVLNESSQK